MSEECIFCKIVNADMPVSLVYEDEDVLAFNDVNPQAPTHILVIPREHITGPAALSPDQETLMGKVLLAATKVAREAGLEDGYRLVMNNGVRAGQTVFHLHLHVLGGRSMSWPPG